MENTYTYQRDVNYNKVLGPLLFIIYINDLPNANSNTMTLFADDSTVVIKCNDRTTYEYDINNTLSAIIKWLDINNPKARTNQTNNFIQNQF